MIIACDNCNKKFDIDANLIPEKGRLLQCSSCNHKWFFKNEAIFKFIEPIKDLTIDKDIKNSKKTSIYSEEKTKKTLTGENKVLKKYNILNLSIICMISFVAIIIIIDTFKYPLSKIFPNIEFLLYNLYESIKDISLFLKNLF
jgi:predicted Zn finger-like uncharacterized protein